MGQENPKKIVLLRTSDDGISAAQRTGHAAPPHKREAIDMRNARDSLALNNVSFGQETAKVSTLDDDTLARQRTGHAAPVTKSKSCGMEPCEP